MRPNAVEVMESIVWTFDDQIAPNVAEDLPRSLAHTVNYLLRHVRLRIEFEAPGLIEDNADLGGLLGEIAAYVRANPELAGLATDERFAAALSLQPSPKGDLANVSAESDILRWGLSDAIEALQAIRDKHRDDPAYMCIRKAIRDYLDRSLEREARWVDTGYAGPRR